MMDSNLGGGDYCRNILVETRLAASPFAPPAIYAVGDDPCLASHRVVLIQRNGRRGKPRLYSAVWAGSTAFSSTC
jgi:hypothetical protein